MATPEVIPEQPDNIESSEPVLAEVFIFPHRQLDEDLESQNGAGKGLTPEQQRLVEANLDLAFGIARKFLGRGMEYDDLVQEGCLGLLGAVQKYNPDRDATFRTFAGYRIAG